MKKKGGYRTVHLSLMWCSGLQTFCKSQCPLIHCCQTACRWPCMLAVFGKETPCRWPCMLAVFGKETPCRWPCMLAVFGKETPCRWPCMLAVFGKEEAKDNGKKRCWWGRGLLGGVSGSPELCAPYHHFIISPTLPLKQFQCVWLMRWCPFLVLPSFLFFCFIFPRNFPHPPTPKNKYKKID